MLFSCLFICLSIHSHILSAKTHGYSVYCSFYNVIIFIYFVVQIVPNLAIGISFKLATGSFWNIPIQFWALSYFLAEQDIPDLPCIFFAPALESAIPPRRFDFIWWRIILRRLNLRSSCIHSYWMSLLLIPLSRQSQEIICMVYIMYVYVLYCICELYVCICIYTHIHIEREIQRERDLLNLLLWFIHNIFIRSLKTHKAVLKSLTLSPMEKQI